ncbi:site-2 protease family protein [Planctomycetota bacterium]
MDIVALGLGWYAAFIISVTLHEGAHALAALRLGDSTAYRGGQVTLDPLPHIRREPFGMVIIPILSYIMGGWMIGWGSAPYDPAWAWDHPRRSAWMALAGPAANLVLVALSALLIRLGLLTHLLAVASSETFSFTKVVEPVSYTWLAGVATFLSILFSPNLILFFFNLLPIPPLDGSAAIALFLRRNTARRLLETLWNPSVSLFGIFIAWNLFGEVIGPLYSGALDLLFLGVVH